MRKIIFVIFLIAVFFISILAGMVSEITHAQQVLNQEIQLDQIVKEHNLAVINYYATEAMVIDWFQAVWGLLGWTIGQPRTHMVGKAMMTVRQGFGDEGNWMQKYKLRPGDMLDISLEAKGKEGTLPDSIGGIYKVLSSEFHQSFVRVDIAYPDPDVDKIKVLLIKASPDLYREKRKADIEKDETKVLGNTVYSGSIEQKVNAEGSPVAIFEASLTDSNDPYVLIVKPEKKGYDASSTSMVMFYAHKPDKWYRLLTFNKKGQYGELLADGESDRVNAELDQKRDASVKIFARRSISVQDIWVDSPIVVVQDMYRGEVISRKVQIPENGELEVKCFSGKVAFASDPNGGDFNTWGSPTTVIKPAQTGKMVIVPPYIKSTNLTATAGKIFCRSKVYSNPGDRIEIRAVPFDENGLDQKEAGSGRFVVDDNGILEVPISNNLNRFLGLIITGKNLTTGEQLPAKKVYAGNSQVSYMLYGFKAGKFRTWRTVGGNPMVPGGFKTPNDFRKFTKTSTFDKCLSTCGKNTERYKAKFRAGRFVKKTINNGSQIFGLGFGEGLSEYWDCRVKLSLTNASSITIIIPEGETGVVPFFVVGFDGNISCGNYGQVYIPEISTSMTSTVSFYKAPKAQANPLDINWMYAGNTDAGTTSSKYSPNPLPGWVPIPEYNSNNSLFQEQTSTNNNFNANWNWNDWNLHNNNINQNLNINNNANALGN